MSTSDIPNPALVPAAARIVGQPVPNPVFVPAQPPVQTPAEIEAAGLAAVYSVPSSVPGQPAHLVRENETAAVVRSRAEQHAKQAAVLKSDHKARLGFDPKSSEVKRPGDPGVAVHIAPSAPPKIAGGG